MKIPAVLRGCALWLMAAALLAPAPARAAFVLQDDFTDGDTAGWTQVGTNATFAVQNVGGNNALAWKHGTSATGAYLPVTNVPNNTTGTLFMRIRTDGGAATNYNLGLSDKAAPGSYPDFESQMRINPADEVNVRDDGSFTGTLATIQDDVWYNVWLVADNTADQSALYMEGPGFTGQELVASGGGFDFRNGTGDSLVTMLLLGQDSSAGTLLIDDVFLDPDGENLVSPVPEPMTTALLGLAGAGLYGYVRRRRSG